MKNRVSKLINFMIQNYIIRFEGMDVEDIFWEEEKLHIIFANGIVKTWHSDNIESVKKFDQCRFSIFKLELITHV